MRFPPAVIFPRSIRTPRAQQMSTTSLTTRYMPPVAWKPTIALPHRTPLTFLTRLMSRELWVSPSCSILMETRVIWLITWLRDSFSALPLFVCLFYFHHHLVTALRLLSLKVQSFLGEVGHFARSHECDLLFVQETNFSCTGQVHDLNARFGGVNLFSFSSNRFTGVGVFCFQSKTPPSLF